jgi:hypothetical protein
VGRRRTLSNINYKVAFVKTDGATAVVREDIRVESRGIHLSTSGWIGFGIKTAFSGSSFQPKKCESIISLRKV